MTLCQLHHTMNGPHSLRLALILLAVWLFPGTSRCQDTTQVVLSIGEARIDANGDFTPDRLGQRVTIGGRANSNSDVMHTSRLSIFLQDNTGGIELYNNDPGPPIEEGDSLIVTGEIAVYEGVTRIVRATYRVLKVHRPMARPVELPIPEAPAEKYEGMLVRVHGVVTRSWSDDYGSYLTVREQTNDADSIVVFLAIRHKPGIDLARIGERDVVSVTGVLGQYVRGGALNTGYEIYPRYPEDIRERRTRTTDYLYALIISAALVVITLAWVFSTRREVAKRTRELRESEQRFRNLLENVQLVALTVNHDARITFANDYTMGLTGWAIDELLAMDLLDVVVPPAGMTRQAYREAVRTGGVPAHFEGELITKAGGRRLVAWNSTVVHNAEGTVTGIASLGEDITERKRAEEKLSASLKEKELLVREVYHRVKNNLQTISSLLSLQSESIADQATRELFLENQHRIRSMTMIHERLYRSSSLARIDMREYLQGLANSLFRSYAVNRNITLQVDVRDVVLSADASIVCGLIVNELLSNTLKHAFPGDRSGEITLTMFPGDHGTYALTFSDNGIGLPPGFDIHATRTLGMNLIASLTQQLHGDIEISTNNGTRYVITIPAA
ncbi:MAG: PAS domain S-box protein [Ignavibacteriae bacterium]|nr:PAS domain S-box protein [Ignavibacteriota bacterium]